MIAITILRNWYHRVRANQIDWSGHDLASNDRSKSGSKLGSIGIRRNENGEIQTVRIGAWRVLNSSKSRHIVSVRQLEEKQRVAVQIALADPFSLRPITIVWEIYDLQGHMESMLQSTDDSSLWIETRSRENNSHLQRN